MIVSTLLSAIKSRTGNREIEDAIETLDFDIISVSAKFLDQMGEQGY